MPIGCKPDSVVEDNHLSCIVIADYIFALYLASCEADLRLHQVGFAPRSHYYEPARILRPVISPLPFDKPEGGTFLLRSSPCLRRVPVLLSIKLKRTAGVTC